MFLAEAKTSDIYTMQYGGALRKQPGGRQMARRRYVDTRWGQVHVREAGDGHAIVLLHESPLSSRVYEEVVGLIGARAHVIAVDTPGYGMSDAPPEECEIPDYAATLLEAIGNLGIDRFVAVGAHTGASLALQLAVQAPNRVTHLVCSGLPLFAPEVRDEYLRSWSPQVDPAGSGEHMMWAWERYNRIWGGPASLVHVGATHLLANLERYHWAYNAAFRYDPEPDLPKITCPVLFLTAADDLLIAEDRRAADRIPGAQLVTVPGLRGQLPLRAPHEFTDQLLEFVLG
jgi:pimeloyl-ACP methyl ester carboxylesterase